MAAQEHEAKYAALGITTEIEWAVIEHLASIGALTSCYRPGGGGCAETCPRGQHCIETTRHNCVCVNS